MSDNYYKNTTDNRWKNTADNEWTKEAATDSFTERISRYSHRKFKRIFRKGVTGKDYNRKPYMTDYFSMMKRPTDKAIWNELKGKFEIPIFEKHSEFKKPYLFPKEDFQEMEHYYPSPHIRLSNPEWPMPEFSGPIPDDWGGWYITGCSLTCTPSIIRDCDKEYCCTLNPAWQPVESIEIEGPATLTREGKEAKKTGDAICFTLNDDVLEGDHIKIKVKTKPKPGQEKIGFCEGSFAVDCDKCDCDVEANVAYSDAGSDDTIDRDGTATIVVTGGCPPFTWSVAGTGFSIPSTSQTRTVLLSADNTACGSATITVTDKCGDTCTGYVRCTTGQWVYKQDGCVLSGAGTEYECAWDMCWELIIGNKRQLQLSEKTGTYNYQNCSDDHCCPHCGVLETCEEPACQECIGDGRIPCQDDPTELLPDRSHCWENAALQYFEWEC